MEGSVRRRQPDLIAAIPSQSTRITRRQSGSRAFGEHKGDLGVIELLTGLEGLAGKRIEIALDFSCQMPLGD